MRPSSSAFAFKALRACSASASDCGLCFRCGGQGQDGTAGGGLSAHQARPLLRPVPRYGLRSHALQLPKTSGRRGEEDRSRGEEEAG
ncbi:ATP synthase subunit e, mitochondrial isoform X1 [Theropithecus gelada]|uniref:ATP synthase subunit e, mitochondrial isoform X1 n=1 Tax=Theropithecus gelada TaxID=9565 RepID=UPI000DC1ACA8|nr:ATP synthase subunit e, mitochondrial isoform X1 [Theropithecus gelada]